MVSNKDKKKVYGNKKFDPNNTEPGYYRARRETVVRVVKNKLFKGVVCVDDMPVDVEEGITEIYLPKIPRKVIEKVHDFFKYTYYKFKSEAVVLLWYNYETDKWSVEVPEQNVSSAFLDYERDPKFEDKIRAMGFTFVGTIHSHGEMGAFHSGTDDDDEFNFDGLHITIGKVLSGPQFSCRFVLKDLQLKRKPEDVMVLPKSGDNIPEDWMNKVKRKTKSNVTKSYGNSSLFDDDWDNYGEDDIFEKCSKYADRMVQ